MGKLVIVYDSETGNTERMAKSIEDGVKSVGGVDIVVKKIGEPFSLKILSDADAIILGAPAYYAYVTPKMRYFIEQLKQESESGRLELAGKLGGAFGSYGWDGGIAIERLALEMENLGIEVRSRVLAQVPQLPFPALNEESQEKCRNLGKDIAENASRPRK